VQLSEQPCRIASARSEQRRGHRNVCNQHPAPRTRYPQLRFSTVSLGVAAMLPMNSRFHRGSFQCFAGAAISTARFAPAPGSVGEMSSSNAPFDVVWRESHHRPRLQPTVFCVSGLAPLQALLLSRLSRCQRWACRTAIVARRLRSGIIIVATVQSLLSVEAARVFSRKAPPNKRMKLTHQTRIKFAYANLPPVWRAAYAWC